MKHTQLLGILFCALSTVLTAQETFAPTTITTGTFLGTTEPLRDFATSETNNFGVDELTIVPNMYEGIVLDEEEYVNRSAASRQYTQGTFKNNAIGVDFLGSSSAESGFVPPDPTGAAGPNHYVHAVNSLVKIFDKEGVLLAGPTSLGAFIGNNENFGDPIVMYDQLADRFFISQFGSVANSLVLAVSQTSDPTGAYNVYQFVFNNFPDYPHYSVWPDGYYLTVNEGGGGGGGAPREAYVIERDVILAGGADPQLAGFVMQGQFSNPTTIHSGEPANLLGTDFPANTPGFITYLQDDSWSSTITFDHLKVWEIAIDWDDISASTISAPTEISVDAFDSLFADFGIGEINQPGTSQELAGQGGIISYAANYRSFDTHNSWVITFNVDVDGNDTSGIRWIELRNTAADPTWTLFQEGTYAPDDGLSRFMSSSAMDAQGNIGLAYNIAGAELAVGIRHTGRYNGDPAGEMTLAEVSILDAPGVQTTSTRFGDYSHTTMDPDNFTFWHTTQYFPSNNFWTTRITSYNLSQGLDTDTGVNTIISPTDGALTAATPVEALVRNFGLIERSNIPITLSVDGVIIANEVVAGPIEPGLAVSYTFTQTADLSVDGQVYTISARTDLPNDQFIENDGVTREVFNTFPNDVGVTALLSPETGEGLGVSDVTIEITNFGDEDQSAIEVQYVLDGGAPVVETFTQVVEALSTAQYTFSEQADLTERRDYTFVLQTNLSGDADVTNDALETVVEHQACIPRAIGSCNIDGIKRFVLNTINADDGGNGCNTEPEDSPQGYSDRTDLSTTLLNLAGDNEYTLQAQHNWPDGVNVEALSVWVDFNDDGIFDNTEQLIAGEFFQEVNVLEDFSLVIPIGAALGPHRLRAKAIDTSASGDINDPCSDFQFGEVQDYTVIIDGSLSIQDSAIAASELTVTSIDAKIFDVNLATAYEGNVHIGVYNLFGQQLTFKPVARTGNRFTVKLDMSAMASGVYLIKMGATSEEGYKAVKIIVQ